MRFNDSEVFKLFQKIDCVNREEGRLSEATHPLQLHWDLMPDTDLSDEHPKPGQATR